LKCYVGILLSFEDYQTSRPLGEKMPVTLEYKKEILKNALKRLPAGECGKILIIPPDITRLNSGAGELTVLLHEILPDSCKVDIMPALGTHVPMTECEMQTMFGSAIPKNRFFVHDWRNDVVHKGTVPGRLLAEWSEGKVDYDVRVEVNRKLFEGYSLIISVGQIVPHEVVGMANYTKNICVGVGGEDIINKSHFLGAVYGMERMMGRTDTPVRKLFNYAADTFLSDLPILYVMTVMKKNNVSGEMEMHGLFAGGEEEFRQAAELSRSLNLDILEKPLKKVVVYLDPEEFKSTWLGNKAVYRTRMGMADGGELIILAPGLREFGEDPEIDRLIRKYGYRGTPATLNAVGENTDIGHNLSAAAHLIHGSSEGRFRIVYCPGPGLSRREIEAAGYDSADLAEMMELYGPDKLKDGFNDINGEDVFFISNPALGLWTV